jgi:two-component system response regulator YesN
MRKHHEDDKGSATKASFYRSYFSLKNILIGSYIVLSILVISIFALVTSKVTEQIITEKENRAVVNSLRNIDDRITLKLDNYGTLMNSLAYSEPTQKLLKHAKTLSNQRQLELVNEVYYKMNEVNVTNTEISAIQLIDLSGKKYMLNNGNYYLEGLLDNYFESPLYDQVVSLNGGLFIDYSGAYSRDTNNLTLFRTINELRGTKPIGVIAMSIKKQALESILFQDSDLALTSLIDISGITVIDAQKELQGTESAISFNSFTEIAYSFQTALYDDNYFITYLKNKDYDYTLVNRAPIGSIYQDVTFIKKVNLYLILFNLLVVVIIAVFLSRTLVKPINELIGLMNRVRQGNLNIKMTNPPLNEIGILANNFNEMVTTLRNSVPLRKEQLIGKLLLGRTADSGLLQQAKELGLPAIDSAHGVAVLEINDRSNIEASGVSIDDVEILLQSELAAIHSSALLHILDARRVIMIVHGEDEDIVPYLHKMLNEQKNIPVTIGVGRFYASAEHIHESYLEALDALNYKHLFDRNGMIYINDIQAYVYSYEQLDNLEDGIVHTVKYMQEEELLAMIDKLFITFKEQFVSKEAMNRTIVNTYLKIFKLMSDRGIDLFGSEQPNIQVPSINNIHLHASAHELKREFAAFLLTATRLMEERREKRMNESIAGAIEIIQSRYIDNELSAGNIAKELHISENYFSKLFKHETGVNFSQYVTTVRMEAAEKLLRQTGYKIGEIALQVGYNDANYFSQCFKGAFGVSPGKYREKQGN